MNRYVFTTLVFLFAIRLTAQTSIEAGIFVGGAVYNGDIDVNLKNFIPQIRPTVGILARAYVLPSIAFRGQFNYIRLYGDEKKYPASTYRQERGFSFKTDVSEFSLQGEWHIIGLNHKLRFDRREPFITIYGLGGISGVFFTPYTNFNEPNPYFENMSADKKGTYSTRTFALIGGGGIKMLLSDQFTLSGELSARRAQSDYLDGISKVISSRSKDYYVTSGIILTYVFNNDTGSMLFNKGRRNIRRFSVCPTF